MRFEVGDVVDLNKYLKLRGLSKRPAIVIGIRKNYIVCRSLLGGYIECINARMVNSEYVL